MSDDYMEWAYQFCTENNISINETVKPLVKERVIKKEARLSDDLPKAQRVRFVPSAPVPVKVTGARVWRLLVKSYDSDEINIVAVIDPLRESDEDFIDGQRKRFGTDQDGADRIIECSAVVKGGK